MRHLVNAENEKQDNETTEMRNLKRASKNSTLISSDKDVKGIRLKTKDEELSSQMTRMAENQKCAQKLLSDHRKKEMEERQNNKEARIPKGQATPMLGRCFSSNDILDLNSPNFKSSAKSLDRAKAVLSLKGKSLKKNDPNYVAKRKRSEESIELSHKRIASSLARKSNIENKEPQESNPAAEIHPDTKSHVSKTVIRSFTGEIIDQERIEELKNKKSVRSHLADEAELQEEESYFDRLQKKEAMEDKVSEYI